MVTSDLLFDFVVDQSTPAIHVKEGETEYVEPFLANEDLAAALDVVARVVEAETHALLAREQMKIVLARGGPDFGPPPGVPMPAAG